LRNQTLFNFYLPTDSRRVSHFADYVEKSINKAKRPAIKEDGL